MLARQQHEETEARGHECRVSECVPTHDMRAHVFLWQAEGGKGGPGRGRGKEPKEPKGEGPEKGSGEKARGKVCVREPSPTGQELEKVCLCAWSVEWVRQVCMWVGNVCMCFEWV